MARGLIAALAVSAGLAACADDPSLDPQSVIDAIPASVVAEDPTVVGSVACPEPEPEVIAQAFTCTATLSDRPITIDVVVDAEGNVTTEVREALFELEVVERGAAARLSADLGLDVTVSCPGVVIVFEVGTAIDCVARHDDRPITFVAEIVDADGNWTLTIGPDEPN